MSEKEDQNTLSEWFANLSHDLRNPVHGILSYAGFGIRKIGSGQLTEEQSLHYYQSIKDAGTKLLGMLDDIVLMAKLETGRIPMKIAEWNLGTVIEGVLSGFSRYDASKGKLPVFREPESPVIGRFDPKQIGDVIRRLLDICIDTTDKDTRLAIQTRSPDSADAANRLGKPALWFSLENPSAEYAAERLNKMQQLLETGSCDGKPGQAGLSLAICHRVIGLHQGVIWIEKSAENGVVFGFLLPA